MRRSGRLTALVVLRDARQVLRGGLPAIEERQRERLAALLAHARAHSAFYTRLYAGLPQDAGLGSLPPVAKAELMAHFDEWVTDPQVTKDALVRFTARQDTIGTDFLGRYVVFTTSGSTGEPTLLVQDRRALAVMNGLAYGRPPYVSRRVMGRMMARGVRAALVFATGGHFLTTVMYTRRVRAVPLRRRYVRFFSVLEPVAQLVQELNAYRPAMLESYASGLEVLAEEQAAGRLRIAPALVACGGEQLLPAVRRRIEEVFGCPLMELYSASEAGPLTLPCRYGEQHLNADWFILEPIDGAGNAVPAGVLSHSVLLTNLANFVQPIIRYELGDSVRLGAAACRCGSPLPTVRIEGRTDEILRLEGPAGTVALLPMALGTVVEETPGVHRFQVLQTGHDALAVRVEALPGHDARRGGRGARPPAHPPRRPGAPGRQPGRRPRAGPREPQGRKAAACAPRPVRREAVARAYGGATGLRFPHAVVRRAPPGRASGEATPVGGGPVEAGYPWDVKARRIS